MTRHSDGDHFLRQDLKRDLPLIVRAEGSRLWDDTGKEYLDGTSGGVGAVLIGHGRSEVVEAMVAQATQLCHAHISLFTTRPAIDLADRIIRDFAPRGMTHAYFVSTGTESTELAVKLARRYHLERGHGSRSKVIFRRGGYHGSSLAALSYCGRSSRRKDYQPYYFAAVPIPPPLCYHCSFGQTYPACDVRCASVLEDTIHWEGADSVSAFIAEPMSLTSGANSAPPEYFPRIREICDKYDVLFVADEVITGWGRTGTRFAIDQWDTVPDMICTAKGIASGYTSLGCTIVHEKVVRAIEPSGRSVEGYTYAGNPLSCAVGNAALAYLTDHGLVERSARLGEMFQERARRLMDLVIVGDVRGQGLLTAIEYEANKRSHVPFPREMRVCETIRDIALSHGLLTYAQAGLVDGVSGDSTILMPPLTTSEEDLTTMLDVLRRSILELQSRLTP